MEKMFVYPETLDSKAAGELIFEEMGNPHSRADIASYRCKLYRTLLEQRTASRQRLAGNHDEHSDAAHA
jgi:hypothetical protein